MTGLIILITGCVVAGVGWNAFMALRNSVVSKARQKAREAVFGISGDAYWAMSDAYYAAGTYEDMLKAWGKWTYEEFYELLVKEKKL